MSTDSSATTNVLPAWAELLHSDNEQEEAEDIPSPIRLFDANARKFLWCISKKLLGSLFYGFGGRVCQLYERYLALRLRHMPCSNSIERSEWEITKQDLKDKTLLLCCVCIQLAMKMSAASVNIDAARLKVFLMKHGKRYSNQEITTAEMDVYNTLCFRIPLWSNVEKAQMLAWEVGFTEEQLKVVAVITEVTDYNRLWVQTHIKRIAFATPSSTSLKYLSSTSGDEAGPAHIDSKQTSTCNIRTLHLAAGAVAATRQFMNYDGPDPVPRLAHYTRSPASYINCICNVIFALLSLTIDVASPDLETQTRRLSESFPSPKRQRRF